MKKIVSLAFVLVLLSTAVVVRFVRPVVADGTIYIRADGSIDPPTANITSADNITYTFTGNINDYIVVERDNIVVDGAGYTLQGPGLYSGIYLEDRSNVTIKNVEVTNLGYGIVLISSNNNTLTGNNASNNDHYGIYLHSSNNNTLNGNTASDNDYYGIYLFSSNSNTLTGNTVSNNYPNGIYLESSNNNTLTGNIASNNGDGIRLYGSNSNTLTGNTASHNGDGIYLSSSNNNTLTGNNNADNRIHGIYLTSSNSNTLTGNIASNNWDGYGIYLASSSNNTLTNNTMSGNEYNFGLYGAEASHFYNTIDDSNTVDDKLIYYLKGVNDTVYNPSSVPDAGTLYLIDCTNITIGNLTLTKNGNGVFLWNTTNSNIQNVTVSNNWHGIYLQGQSNCSNLTDNTVSNNVFGIRLDSNNNTIYGNDITSNTNYGVWLSGSSNNTISGNKINNSYYGVYLESSSNNNFYHNNFIDSTQQVFIQTSGPNFWDDGYPSGGNYWSDYAGVDLFSGPHQNVSGCDGIGDTPYVMDVDNRDNYPLMEPYPDTKPPTITILSPENKAYATTSIPLTFTIDECTRRIWYSLDGESNVTITGNTTLSGLSEGVHTIAVYANDTAGNMDSSDIVHFTVDTVFPNINILSPENKTYTTSSVSLDFAVSEPTSWISYSLDGQANVTITENTTLTGLLDGVHYVVVYANDTAGNMGTSSTVYFTVDTTPPNITDVSQTPPENNVLPQDEVKINTTVTDNLSGVKQVTLNYTNGDGTWITVDMTNLEGNIWNATIPAFPYCTNVTYIIIAENNANNTITTEEMEYKYKYHVIPEFPTWTSMLFILIVLTVAIAVYKRRLVKTPIH